MKSAFSIFHRPYIRHLMSLAVIIHITRTLVRAFVRSSRITSFSCIQSTKDIFLNCLAMRIFPSTNVPIVVSLNRVLRPSNKKSTVIGNITHEWPRLRLKKDSEATKVFRI